MSSKKQKGIRMKRRTFVILILSVCVIAIGAEVALLVHSFTKRNKGAGKEPGKDPGEYVSEVSPAPSNPTPGGETEQPRKIYVKVKEETVQSAERTPDGEFLPAEPYSTASYSYDEYGRLKRKEISFYGKDARDFSSTYIYEPSGTITETQSVYHETNDEPERKAFDKTYELPYGFTFSDSTGSNVTISYDEDGYWKKVVCGVPHEEAEFTYDEEGRRIKASLIQFQGQSDDTAVIIEDEYAYLEDGTVILTRSSKDMEAYSGRITNYDVMTYRDGRLMKRESYSDDVDSLHWIYEYKYTNAGRWESYSVIGDPHEDRGGTCFYLETGESFPPQIASWDASVYDDFRFETDQNGNASALYGIAGSEEHKIAYIEYDDNGRPVHFYEISRWDEQDTRYRYDDEGNLTEIFTTELSDQSYQEKTIITYEEIPVRDKQQ